MSALTVAVLVGIVWPAVALLVSWRVGWRPRTVAPHELPQRAGDPMGDATLSVLRACEVVEITAGGQVRCGTAGQLWASPSGKTYAICDEHRSCFESSSSA